MTTGLDPKILDKAIKDLQTVSLVAICPHVIHGNEVCASCRSVIEKTWFHAYAAGLGDRRGNITKARNFIRSLANSKTAPYEIAGIKCRKFLADNNVGLEAE